jgi:xanthine dehydrogenase accessory factor
VGHDPAWKLRDTMGVVLIRGSGDVGSAVAHALHRADYAVLLHDDPRPSHARRGMSFTDALYDGVTILAGVVGKRARDVADLTPMMRCRRAIPLTDVPIADVVGRLLPQIVVDARMRKRVEPEPQHDLAPVVVGLGPNYETGLNADVVVETAWGDDLGRVIRSGRSRDFAGEPRVIAGHGRDRYVYSPCAGEFTTALHIGDAVTAGQQVARVEYTVLTAPLSGRLRGLTHTGAQVTVGSKVVEIDPREASAQVFGLGERPMRIADGVLEAVSELHGRT